MPNNDIDTPLLIFSMFFMVAMFVCCVGFVFLKCTEGTKAQKHISTKAQKHKADGRNNELNKV